MADLVKAVSKTVFPNGMTQVYENGMLVKKQPIKDFNNWCQWIKRYWCNQYKIKR